LTKHWTENRVDEITEQIKNTITWLFDDKDEYDSREALYVSFRLYTRLCMEAIYKSVR